MTDKNGITEEFDETTEVEEVKITPDSKEDSEQVEKAIELSKNIAGILDAKKALDVKIINVHDKTIIADCFVFATGTSSTQVNALADEIEFRFTQNGSSPLRTEGQGSGSWVLIDYGSVIVHVFSVQAKEFYKLEKLWAEGREIPFDKIPDDNN